MFSIILYLLLIFFSWIFISKKRPEVAIEKSFEELELNHQDPTIFKLLETIGSIVSVKQSRNFNTLGSGVVISLVLIYLSQI